MTLVFPYCQARLVDFRAGTGYNEEKTKRKGVTEMMAFPMVWISYFLGVIYVFAEMVGFFTGRSADEVIEEWGM